MAKHLEQDCPLRPVPCPFRECGCGAALVCRDVGAHLESGTQAHLLLAASRILEQQEALHALRGRVGGLEAASAQHGERLAGLAASVTAVGRASAEAEAKLTKRIGEVEKTGEKRASALSVELGKLSSGQKEIGGALTEHIQLSLDEKRAQEKIASKFTGC